MIHCRRKKQKWQKLLEGIFLTSLKRCVTISFTNNHVMLANFRIANTQLVKILSTSTLNNINFGIF